MKPVPPPLPKKTPIVSGPTQSHASAANGNDQSALMIGGLVALLLFVLGLLIVIAILIRKEEAVSGASDSATGSVSEVDTLVIGEEANKPKVGEASKPADSIQAPRNEAEQNRPQGDTSESPHDPVTKETEAEPTEATATEVEAPNVKNKPETEKPPEDLDVELPEELPKGARVFPLYSEPSTATAQSLETSNPFLDAGKANSIVFVIDKSSSMSGRLERVIAALREAIEKLDSKQSFQLFFFDSVPYQHPNLKGLVKATKQNKGTMFKWVNSFVTADGGTDPLAAILRAIELKPDRIVVLSDGEFDPSHVDTITRANFVKPKERIRIDCIGLDEVVESLRQIAKQNGPGVYYQAR